MRCFVFAVSFAQRIERQHQRCPYQVHATQAVPEIIGPEPEEAFRAFSQCMTVAEKYDHAYKMYEEEMNQVIEHGHAAVYHYGILPFQKLTIPYIL